MIKKPLIRVIWQILSLHFVAYSTFINCNLAQIYSISFPETPQNLKGEKLEIFVLHSEMLVQPSLIISDESYVIRV